jgi:hypothetical protein
VILSIKDPQSAEESLVEMRGTPRYLTGRCPSIIFNSPNSKCLILSEIPEQKKELFDGLAFKPERTSYSNLAADFGVYRKIPTRNVR